MIVNKRKRERSRFKIKERTEPLLNKRKTERNRFRIKERTEPLGLINKASILTLVIARVKKRNTILKNSINH